MTKEIEQCPAQPESDKKFPSDFQCLEIAPDELLIPQAATTTDKERWDDFLEDEPVALTLSTFVNNAMDALHYQPGMIDIQRELGSSFLDSFLDDLSLELYNEVGLARKKSPEKQYVSLVDLCPTEQIRRFSSGEVDALVVEAVKNKRNENARYLVNLVFPCRNSSALVEPSFELLLSEIKKSEGINFNVVFQVNNTSDNTLQVIAELLHRYGDTIPNTKVFIVETESDIELSLPGSLNLGHSFLMQTDDDRDNEQYEERFFSFWDDELMNVIATPQSLFVSNIEMLLSSPDNKAVSGYMIDNRINVSRWHELCKGFSSDLRFLHSKPYLHGGAGMVCRIEDFPQEGIKAGGIADSDLSEHFLRLIGYGKLQTLPHEQWPVRINPASPVFHPIESDILSWTTKYLMYQAAWDNIFYSATGEEKPLCRLWQSRIQENRRDFHQEIDPYLRTLSPQKRIEREFMRRYYLAVQDAKDKKGLYERFKLYRKRSLEIR